MDSTIGTAISGLLGTIIALAIVLGIAWFVLKAMRQWQDRGIGRRPGEPDRQLRFIRALPVGQRERVMLIEAEGEVMLIGVATGSVRLLRNWGKEGAPLTPTDLPEGQADPGAHP
ncbi:FliO/MopB family protein [Sphingomonas crocodyli]|nr:flagellar biosynthetic protein FliO [Sphingomonas crocodyli]